MFRRRSDADKQPQQQQPSAAIGARITSVLADGISQQGKLTGAGGVRIEGAYDGEIELDGLLVISPTGRVTCPQLRAKTVIIAGALRGDILAEKVEIRASGRVWGDVVAESISTEEGAFLRGQIQMEEQIDWGDSPLAPKVELAVEEDVDETEAADAEQPKAKKTPKQTKTKDPMKDKKKAS